MKINLKNGIDILLFGMQQKDVIACYGNPDKQFKDDDDNIIYLYNSLKLRLTFYQDEDFRLGYIITSNSNATLFDNKIIGELVEKVISDLPFKNWETEDFDSTTNHFNESNWFTIQSEFNEITKIELGAIINEKTDEFVWKFKG